MKLTTKTIKKGVVTHPFSLEKGVTTPDGDYAVTLRKRRVRVRPLIGRHSAHFGKPPLVCSCVVGGGRRQEIALVGMARRAAFSPCVPTHRSQTARTSPVAAHKRSPVRETAIDPTRYVGSPRAGSTAHAGNGVDPRATCLALAVSARPVAPSGYMPGALERWTLIWREKRARAGRLHSPLRAPYRRSLASCGAASAEAPREPLSEVGQLDVQMQAGVTRSELVKVSGPVLRAYCGFEIHKRLHEVLLFVLHRVSPVSCWNLAGVLAPARTMHLS